MTGSFLLVPHIQDLLAWYGLWLILITGEISNFLEFYIFVGCVVWLVNPILMGNVEVLLMFFDALATSPDDYLDLDLVEKLKSWHWL